MTDPHIYLSDRIVDSLNDAEAMDGYDSATQQIYWAAGKDLALAAVVERAVADHDGLVGEWPSLMDVVDPRLPLILRGDKAHKRPLPYDPGHPRQTADRLGLVAGYPQKLFALRGEWRAYWRWARDIAPEGKFAHHMPTQCALERSGFGVTGRCAGHTGGQFIVLHKGRYLVAVPLCFACKDVLLSAIPPQAHTQKSINYWDDWAD